MHQEGYENKGYLLEDFRLFHLRGEAGIKTEYHYHEFYKLLFLIAGSGGYWIAGQRYLLQPGDIVLVGSGCVHKPEFEPGSVYERIILYISPEFLQKMAGDGCDLTTCFRGTPSHVLRSEKNDRLLRMAEEMEQTQQHDAFGRTVMGASLLLRLLVEITRQLQKSQAPQPQPVTDDRVLGLMRYIDAHIAEDLTVDRLAEECYWSKYHMMRRFRAQTGSSIGQYITQRRLMLARTLISGGTPATDACFRAGFGSYSAFTRTYGKFFGTTPTGRRHSAARPIGTEE